MAGPVSTYITTQTAAQTAFTVPFGLLAFVNAAIATAVAAGEFNVTVDCSLFVTEDVSNLRIYLDSLGYHVNFAKDTNNKSLNIDWGTFLAEAATIVYQGTSPWVVSGTVAATQSGSWTVSLTSGSIEIGTVDQGTPTTNANAWPVYLQRSSTAIVSAITVTGSSTILLAANPTRKGFTVQCKTTALYLTLGALSSPSLYSSYLLKLNEYERTDYTGVVSAILDSGSATVMVTELV